jgi:hypothetical protein
VSLSNFERYQRIAWAYDLLDLPFEYGRYRKIRPLLFRDFRDAYWKLASALAGIFRFTRPGLRLLASTQARPCWREQSAGGPWQPQRSSCCKGHHAARRHEPTCGRCAHTIREIMGDDKRKQVTR